MLAVVILILKNELRPQDLMLIIGHKKNEECAIQLLLQKKEVNVIAKVASLLFNFTFAGILQISCINTQTHTDV